MTLYVADVARWQRDLPLSELVKASFGAVNIKISHGLTSGVALYPDQPDDIARAKEAKALGLRLCTFHWLDASASGEAQAQVAFKRMKAMPGGPAGIAHSVDAEDQNSVPTWDIWTGYIATMQSLLDRPIASYTGDWWWQQYMAGRFGGGLSRYLWAAPNVGYLTAGYPGDTSAHWTAGYSGWKTLAAMQYVVEPPFGPGVTSKVNISKTAIRDPQVWKDLTGVAW